MKAKIKRPQKTIAYKLIIKNKQGLHFKKIKITHGSFLENYLAHCHNENLILCLKSKLPQIQNHWTGIDLSGAKPQNRFACFRNILVPLSNDLDITVIHILVKSYASRRVLALHRC
jgi:hypothetical protein